LGAEKIVDPVLFEPRGDAVAAAADSTVIEPAPDSLQDSAAAARPLECRLSLGSVDTGLRAILAGLSMLERSGRIRARLEPRQTECDDLDAPWHLRNKAAMQATLRVGDRTAVLDVHDSWEVDEAALRSHDLYFKRSLHPVRSCGPGSSRLRPLGLLSDVRPDGLDVVELRRIVGEPVATGRRALNVLRFLGGSVASILGLGARPTLARMHAAPIAGQPPRVLFMTRLWDPDAVPGQAPHKRAEFEKINETRVAVARRLRREFGARFTGGIVHSEFARRHSPDLLLPDPGSARQMRFIELAREHAVCVTSVGLHGSNGFRMAEFIALSRAIVSEPLRYAVPGNLAEGAHYLAFETPGQCVERVARLFDHPAEREEMMLRNRDYYLRWLRPDRLAWRLIALTLGSRP
jgi:hypothetical protein